MHLNNRARELLDGYSAGMAQQFGARDASRYFSLNNPQENALRLALLESVEFLDMLTCLDVDQLSGQVISVGSSVLHTGRSESGRFIRQVGVDGNDYSLVETDSCAALRWDLLSVWANAGKDENEFYNLVQAFTTQAFALDMLRIGFNGKSRAKTTDPEANPNGEDVNIGWHERMKALLGGNQIMTDPVVLDAAGDYKSLDAMASDLINAKIPAQFRNDPRLVVLVGADLVAAEQYRLYQAADRPTEKIAAQMLGNTIAGRPAIIPPFMPGKRMVVTVPGADEESDDELRERCRNQFNLVGNYHTDAVYRSMIAGVAGLSIDRIFFEHEAPRGPGTANAYLLLDSGVASAPFVDAVNDYINTQGHHGHGDDMQCYAMPETLHDLAVTVWVRNLNNISDDEQKRLKDGIENLIRCAFRENTDYDVRRTWPYSRFSFSQLGREIHKNFPVTESLNFSLDDIASELNVPRLKSLVVSIENE